jgi:hypothetical protein
MDRFGRLEWALAGLASQLDVREGARAVGFSRLMPGLASAVPNCLPISPRLVCT